MMSSFAHATPRPSPHLDDAGGRYMNKKRDKRKSVHFARDADVFMYYN